MGIAFVKCERVNNTISPECHFYGAPNALKTISNLEVVSPKERIINCILKFYLWLLCLASLFIISQCVPSGNNAFGPQNLRASSFTKAEKANGMAWEVLLKTW